MTLLSRLTWRTPAAPIDEGRWIVIDVEASGPIAARDRLLAIAGLALHWPGGGGPRIDFGDSFEIVLRQSETPLDKPNVLLHGIGVGAQRSGVEPGVGLAAFARWVARSPLIAFHAIYDGTMIRRALRASALPPLPNPWVDLARVAEVVRPDLPAKSLDEWLAHFGIEVAVRHQAAADALATAELLLRLWSRILAQRAAPGFAGLLELDAQRRWLRST